MFKFLLALTLAFISFDPLMAQKREKDEVIIFEEKGRKLELSLWAHKSVAAMRNTRNYIKEVHKDGMDETRKLAKEMIREKDRSLGASYHASYSAFWASDNFLSLHGSIYTFSGGAHGSTTYDSAIFDLVKNRRVNLNEIIIDIDKDTTVTMRLFYRIQAEVAKEKLIRDAQEESKGKPVEPPTAAQILARMNSDDFIKEMKFSKDLFSNYALMSNIGGPRKEEDREPKRTPVTHIAFFYEQYIFGAYAEGVFEILIPISYFKDQIKPEWRHYFAL